VVIVRMTRISVFFCSSCFSCFGVLPLFSLRWMERGAVRCMLLFQLQFVQCGILPLIQSDHPTILFSCYIEQSVIVET
jgi:hypothetical protein